MYNSLITNFVTQKNWIMRSTFKVLFYVNGSKEKNGIVPIMGRLTINGSVAQFSCKRTIPKELWDVKGNRAKGKSKESRDINLALDKPMAIYSDSLAIVYLLYCLSGFSVSLPDYLLYKARIGL